MISQIEQPKKTPIKIFSIDVSNIMELKTYFKYEILEILCSKNG